MSNIYAPFVSRDIGSEMVYCGIDGFSVLDFMSLGKVYSVAPYTAPYVALNIKGEPLGMKHNLSYILIDDNGLRVTLDSIYFCTIEDWRDRQINSII